MKTQEVYEAFYDLWRQAEAKATENGEDIQRARQSWPNVGSIRMWLYKKTDKVPSKAAVKYHVMKLVGEGLVRRDSGGREAFYPAGLYFNEIEKAQL